MTAILEPDLSIRERGDRQFLVRERSFAQHGVEMRSTPDGTGGEKLIFRGYASVYDFDYPINDWMGTYIESIARGAFTKSLADGADVPFKINHAGMTLARTKAGNLRLDPRDSYGLAVEAELNPQRSEVRDLRLAMDDGNVDEMSFAFATVPGGSEWSDGSTRCVRTAVDIHRGDVSVVNYGSNPATAGAKMRAREFVEHPELMSEFEQRQMFERLAAKFDPQISRPGMSRDEIQALLSA